MICILSCFSDKQELGSSYIAECQEKNNTGDENRHRRILLPAIAIIKALYVFLFVIR